MYTLYFSPGTASLAVHWLLIEIGVPHELVRVNLDSKEQKTEAYLRLNPTGMTAARPRPKTETAAEATV